MFHLYLSKQIIYSYLFFKTHYFSRIFLILEIDTNREQLRIYYIMFYLSLLKPVIYNCRLMCWNHITPVEHLSYLKLTWTGNNYLFITPSTKISYSHSFSKESIILQLTNSAILPNISMTHATLPLPLALLSLSLLFQITIDYSSKRCNEVIRQCKEDTTHREIVIVVRPGSFFFVSSRWYIAVRIA